jgi:hypothetical protein
MKHRIFNLIVLSFLICGCGAAKSTVEEKPEFINPFGYFKIENIDGEPQVVLDKPIDEDTFRKYFKEGTYWCHGAWYSIREEGVDTDILDYGATITYWIVRDSCQIDSYSPRFTAIHCLERSTYGYSYSEPIFRLGGVRHHLCNIDDNSMMMVMESSVNGERHLNLMFYHRITEEEFKKTTAGLPIQ